MASIGMRQSARASLKHKVKPWVQLQTIIRHKLLVKTNQELLAAVEEELRDNPAIEVLEPPELDRRKAEAKQKLLEEVRKEYRDQQSRTHRDNLDELLGNPGEHYEDPDAKYYAPDDEEYDPLTNTSNQAGDLRALLKRGYRQIYPEAPHSEIEVADAIIDMIESDGLLHCPVETIASDLGISEREFKKVQWQLTQTDPPGIGASTPQEALLAQMSYLRSIDPTQPLELPERILRDHYHLILEGRVSHLPRELQVSSRQVEQALHFIAENLFPYPGELLPGSLGGVERVQGITGPDVIIRAHENAEGKVEYLAEVQDAGLPKLRISRWYQEAYNRMKNGTVEFNAQEKEHIQSYFDRAYWFLENLNTRSDTLRKVTEALIEIQRPFLDSGILGLKPLTQEDLANVVGVHPSTISRALNGKFVQLPDARLVPFTVFFDYQQVVIEVIRMILADETPDGMYSDQAISEELTKRNFEVARRTVAKYRDIGGIPPKGQRKRALIRQREESDATAANAVPSPFGDQVLTNGHPAARRRGPAVLDIDDEDDGDGEDDAPASFVPPRREDETSTTA